MSARASGALGWRILALSACLYVVGGGISAATWRAEPGDQTQVVDECPDPPCFDFGGAPSPRDLVIVVPTLGFLLAILLGTPGLVKWLVSVVRGRASKGQRGWLFFFGPLLVLLGAEVVPHLLNPCVAAQLTGAEELPGICERTQHGIDVRDQWHALSHSLTGGLVMTWAYWMALRRWRPDVLKREKAEVPLKGDGGP